MANTTYVHMSTLKKIVISSHSFFILLSFFLSNCNHPAIDNPTVETNVINWIAAVISDYVVTLIFQLYQYPYSISAVRHLYHSCISAVSQLHVSLAVHQLQNNSMSAVLLLHFSCTSAASQLYLGFIFSTLVTYIISSYKICKRYIDLF